MCILTSPRSYKFSSAKKDVTLFARGPPCVCVKRVRYCAESTTFLMLSFDAGTNSEWPLIFVVWDISLFTQYIFSVFCKLISEFLTYASSWPSWTYHVPLYRQAPNIGIFPPLKLITVIANVKRASYRMVFKQLLFLTTIYVALYEVLVQLNCVLWSQIEYTPLLIRFLNENVKHLVFLYVSVNWLNRFLFWNLSS